MSKTERPQLDWPAEKAKSWIVDNCFLMPDGEWYPNIITQPYKPEQSDTPYTEYESMVVEGICKIVTNADIQVEQAIFDHLQVVCNDQWDHIYKCRILQAVLSERANMAEAFFALMDMLELTQANGFIATSKGNDLFDLMVAYRAYSKGGAE